MSRAKLLVAGAAFGLLLLAGFPPAPQPITTPPPAHLLAAGTAPYHYFGADDFHVCNAPPPGMTCNQTLQYWSVDLHVAGWANGYNVQLATGSGYPWCSAQGYSIAYTACTWHGGGTQIYATIAWQNCIGPFGIGCFDDSLTVGFNAAGRLDYDHEAWLDGAP